MRSVMFAFGMGALFSAGLLVSGMTDPANIKGFLDIAGEWRLGLAPRICCRDAGCRRCGNADGHVDAAGQHATTAVGDWGGAPGWHRHCARQWLHLGPWHLRPCVDVDAIPRGSGELSRHRHRDDVYVAPFVCRGSIFWRCLIDA